MISYEDMPILLDVARLLIDKKVTVSTAESCTGGMVGMTFTSLAGSSTFYEGGIISYSNAVKVNLLQVDSLTLEAKGAVSEEVACQMAEGVRRALRTTYGISTTGIAGPGGGTDKKPVGLVYMAVSGPKGTKVFKHLFEGHRHDVRVASTKAILTHLLYVLQENL